MAYDLFSVIASWQEIGVFGVLLPFVLVFALSFAVLQKTKILGDHKNLNVIVSLVLGLLFLQNVYLVEKIQLFLPNVSFAVLVLLALLLLVGVFAGDKLSEWTKEWKWFAIIAAIIAIVWALTSDYLGEYSDFFGWLSAFSETSIFQYVLLGVLVALVIFFVKGKDEPGGGGGGHGAPRNP